MADLNLGSRSFVPVGHVDVTTKHHKTIRRVGPLLKRAHISFGGDLCLVSLLVDYLHADHSPLPARTSPRCLSSVGLPALLCQLLSLETG
jgi:hypothetical protein